MEIRCRCSSCQAKFKVDAKYAGKKARCPKCQQVVAVPSEDLEATTTSQPSLATAQGMGSSTVVPPTPAGAPAQPASAHVAVGNAVSQPMGGSAASAGASSAPSPSDSFASLQLQTARKPGAAKASAGNFAASGAKGKRGKTSNGMALAVGGGVLAMVLLLGVGAAIWALSQPVTAVTAPRGSGTAGNATASNSTTLILDWPDAEREQAWLSIDGRRKTHANSGELKFDLPPGPHKVMILRSGFEPFESEITLASGQTQRLAPQWKAVATLASTTPAVGAGGSSPIGTVASVSTIRGFEGWLQSFEQARQQATAEDKDILVLLGISDVQRLTQQLGQTLQAGELATITSGMVRVVIDFPRTVSDRERLERSVQNQHLMDDFGIRRLPALVLADAAGRAYFVKQEWPEGPQHVQANFTIWQQQRAERDRLLAAAQQGSPEEQLTAAAAAVKWLQDKRIWQFHRSELDSWLAAAQQADPSNQKSVLETFFEPHWMLESAFINDEDSAAVGQLVAKLDPWVARKFQDQDRGAKLHLRAAQLLQGLKDHRKSMIHLEHATKYQPKDSQLADAMRQLRTMLENRDIAGSGTGYLVSAAGYVLTNHHVIEGPGAIVVRLLGSKENIPARLVADDSVRDIALLKLTLPEPDKQTPLAIATEPARRGASVAAFGYPLVTSLGAGLKFTDGAVSALPDDTNDQMYLLDLTVNPGNSGGPLCDRRGNVVGMITAMTGNSGFANSYGLAVPAADLIKFLDKHLPPGTPRATPAKGDANLDWDQVDEKVSSGVLMILKKR